MARQHAAGSMASVRLGKPDLLILGYPLSMAYTIAFILTKIIVKIGTYQNKGENYDHRI